jgi:hypothetical protein
VCGIFGLFARQSPSYQPKLVRDAFTSLALLSESRGKDSSGLVFRDERAREFQVFKGTLTLRKLLKAPEVSRQVRGGHPRNGEAGGERHPFLAFAAMGHSRLVTNGSQLTNENNQPVIKDGVIGVHNGIIVNDAEIWAAHPGLTRSFDIDTEVMLAVIRDGLSAGRGVTEATCLALKQVFGTVSAALLFQDFGRFVLATNNGSLYTLTDGAELFAFASEEYFLRQTALRIGLDLSSRFAIVQIASGGGMSLDLYRFQARPFTLAAPAAGDRDLDGREPSPYRISVTSVSDERPQRELIIDPAAIASRSDAAARARHLEWNIDRIRALRRCSRCILPETFPFIEFDEKGVCNYCNHYVLKNHPKPMEELFELVAPYRRKDGGYDCIVPYSGGRDSTHTLHVVKTVLKLNPVALTYDWGMVTDLARRNIARVCGKLGVENIIVSADINRKRRNIRNNIVAWLRKPNLGMVPLFMAGDKYFYYYTDQVKKQTGVKLNIWGINPLENTDFKVGFLGVPPDHHKKRIYSLSARRKARLLAGVGACILRNPAYLNSSVWDTIGSFVSRSIVPHRDYYHMYDYLKWDEHEIESLVLDEYRWERAIDTRTTWRIGDGTAPFYNYIYYTVAGFSEYDTFRSNQIREGMLMREKALQLVEDENRPRYPSIRWYTDIVGIDFESAIRTINAIPKLYP